MNSTSDLEHSASPLWPQETRQSYVRKFALLYCLASLSVSAFFTPQDFNPPVAIIVNILLYLIGAPYWFRNSTRLTPYSLNVISQVANAGATIWICSFLGPTSHINIVAIPNFIMALMMFHPVHSKSTVASAAASLALVMLPVFPFVDSWYAHKRMIESNLVILRSIVDIMIVRDPHLNSTPTKWSKNGDSKWLHGV